MSINALQDYTFTAKYARYSKIHNRRETWSEAVDRVKEMHLKKYADKGIDEEIEWSFSRVKKKLVLGSQRALQFGGDPCFKHNARMYNCCYTYIDRPRVFQEIMYLLLCGCGVGFSVQKCHIEKLPRLVKEKNGSKKFVIPDNIEGWADAIGITVTSYLEQNDVFPEYSGKNVVFDYTQIRPEGSPLSYGGKAPGPEPLKKAIHNIKKILDLALSDGEFSNKKLRPIQCYDIIMHASDAVLSGGIRRSATISLFSKDDEEMTNAKTGNWFNENPQRARSNNSALLVRDELTREEFHKLFSSTKEFGEPGFIFASSEAEGFNPCQPAWAKVLTPNGLSTIGDIDPGDKIWSSEGWTTVVKKWSTGSNNVYKYTTNNGVFYGTENHRVLCKGKKVAVKDADYIDSLVKDNLWIYPYAEKLTNNARKELLENTQDVEYFRFNTYEDEEVDAFTSDKRTELENIQCVLSSKGIQWTIHELDKDDQRTYKCKQFVLRTGGVIDCGYNPDYENNRVINTELISYEETFDITVDNPSHTYWTQCCNVSNCAEISFIPYDEITGKTGFQFCNLTEINGKKIKDVETFKEACRASAIIGTLQAGYTNFPYLTEATENITKREALLGCSITGIMENPDVLLDPTIQREMAKYIKKINKEIAAKIGINQAARTTCVKPAGSTSCLLGSSSGIHPHHAKRYIRRVQANKNENVYQFFKSNNPLACEESVWSANNTDDVISFCVEVPAGAKTKNQMSAIDLLEAVKTTQQNWVEYGTNADLSIDPNLRHNVSNTINVKPEEWDEVENFIYKNRKYFSGISLLPITGDKTYKQPPFTAIYLPSEMQKHYGNYSMFVSGLIEQAMQLWEDDLWDACDALLGVVPVKGSAKKLWIDRCKRFAEKYNGGDIKKLSYCMKDVYNYKTWLDLQRIFKDVDYTQLIEDEDNTKIQETVACAGGACEII